MGHQYDVQAIESLDGLVNESLMPLKIIQVQNHIVYLFGPPNLQIAGDSLHFFFIPGSQEENIAQLRK
jgi:hypothetical protein